MSDMSRWRRSAQNPEGGGEHRYLDLLLPKIGLSIDRDDTRKSGAGEYSRGNKRLLTVSASERAVLARNSSKKKAGGYRGGEESHAA